MGPVLNLPCDGEGMCMVCKEIPGPTETLTCKTCVTPWHVSCVSESGRPKTMEDTVSWECPDCSFTVSGAESENLVGGFQLGSGGSEDLVGKIRAIEGDSSLSEMEKARLRQELLSGKVNGEEDEEGKKKVNGGSEVLDILDESFNCSFCMQLPERPVTTPCGHNFCLKCFEKWIGQGKRTCAKCRAIIPPGMAKQPRINSALVVAIRAAKMERSGSMSNGQPKIYHHIHNQDRPDQAFTTDRAKKTGKANACSGKIFVTIPNDFFGPITADYDPGRNRGVLVGDTWEDRLSCRQWGAHFPHVAGIAGQSEVGAQSVALSGGYLDDEDHGEWFLYTGSGGRDLSGNKRTNKDQSFDQKFDKSNEALRVSCRKGYPVRVVRSFKEKRSAYAPPEGVRYDGVYRIEKCWRKVGIQGYKVCRYLFVRCDNEPAPWTSDEHGDRPRPFPEVKELEGAIDLTERKANPSWDFDEEKACWMWKKDPPASKKQYEVDENGAKKVRRQNPKTSTKMKLLKEFSCLLCKKVMVQPLTTPCAHNFCKACLEGVFAGQSAVIQRTCQGRRSLRAQKNVMRCPSCKNDISDFLQSPQVNRDLMNVIEKLQQQTEEEDAVIEDADGTDTKIHESNNEAEGTVLAADDGEEADGDNKSETSAGDKENLDVNAVVKVDKAEEKEGAAKVGNNTKSEQEHLQKNLKTDGNVSREMSPEESTVEVADSEPCNSKEDEEIIAPVNKVVRTNKRKKVGSSTTSVTFGGGRQTRSKTYTN
ncbi:ubiquitin-protein ligase [Lithospermum erythrorhizon]|uniref:RING-type E3 ubiquitin transferase n=1 Tax=Lithospermum erythrorhizon TaxID=34254 RepID=A0AAV3NKJ1_LITER